jgi:hypothetical protein
MATYRVELADGRIAEIEVEGPESNEGYMLAQRQALISFPQQEQASSQQQQTTPVEYSVGGRPVSYTQEQLEAGQPVDIDQPSGLLQSVVNAPRNIANWITSQNKREDIPTLGQGVTLDQLPLSAGNKARLAGLLTTTIDNQRIIETISDMTDKASFGYDEFNNLVVNMRVGTQDDPRTISFYPNPRGLDVPTAAQVSGAATVGAKLAPLFGEGLLGASALSATEAGLTETASQLLAGPELRGGELRSPINLSRILEASGYGAVLGPVFQFLGNKSVSALSGFADLIRSGSTVIDNQGNLTKAAVDYFESQGINPEEVRNVVAEGLSRRLSAGAMPEAALVTEQAAQLPTPIPLSRGQVTGSERQQVLESQLLSGEFGEAPRATMQSQVQGQREAIVQNVDQIKQEIAGQSPIVTQSGEGGALVQQSLAKMREAEAKAARELYDTAKASEAFVDPNISGNAGQIITSQLSQDFSRINAPQTFAILDDLSNMIEQGDSIANIYAKRSILSNQARQGGPEGGSAGTALRLFDDQMDELATNNLLYGDPSSVSNWAAAIKSYRELQRKWNDNGILKKLTETGNRDGDNVLNVSPDAAARAILGDSFGRISTRNNLLGDLSTLKKTLPKNDWNQIRQEAFVLLANDFAGIVDGNVTAAGRVDTAWNNARKNMSGTGVLETLFSKEERQLIDNFVKVAKLATTRAANRSFTGSAIANYVRSIAQSLGIPAERIASFTSKLPVINRFVESGRETAARQAFTEPVQALRRQAPSVAGIGGFTAAEQQQQPSPMLQSARQAQAPQGLLGNYFLTPAQRLLTGRIPLR